MNHIYSWILATMLVTSFLLPTSSVFAQTTSACLNVPLPGLPGIPDPCSSPAAYIQYWFYLGMYLGGVAALMAIVLAGAFRVFFAYNPSQTAKADHYITNATLGLILLFGSWLLLRTLGGPAYTNLQNPVLPPLPFPGSYGEGISCTKDTEATVCKPPTKCIVSTTIGAEGTCANGSQGDYCVKDTDCQAGMVCIDPIIGLGADEGCGKPDAPEENQTCTLGDTSSCPAGFYCGDSDTGLLGSDYCQDGSYGDACNTPGHKGECQEGLFCQDPWGTGGTRCLPLY